MTKFQLVTTTSSSKLRLLHSSKAKLPKPNQTLKTYINSNNGTTKALLLFRDLMRKSPNTIDSYTFFFVLKACHLNSQSLLQPQQIHTQIIKFGFLSVIQLPTLILLVYASKGDIVHARQMFDQIPYKNVVTWTALLSTYVHNHRPKHALRLFNQMMLMDNVEPDKVTLTVALSACADLGSLEMGKWIHAYIFRKKQLDVDISLINALINMYTKCGEFDSAVRMFHSAHNKDVATWTSMIVGYALNGQAKQALKLFEEMNKCNKNMNKTKVLPNEVTFIGVLMACSHAGLVEEGKQYFKSMIDDYNLKPRDSHFGCLVDIFCRAGLLKEAYDFITVTEMPMQPNAVVWRTLLGACSIIGDVTLGDEIKCKLLALDPRHSGDNVTMSNIYASKGMWDKKIRVREENKRKSRGYSWIEIKSVGISEFVTADIDHPMTAQIYEVIKQLLVCIKAYEHSSQLSIPLEQ